MREERRLADGVRLTLRSVSLAGSLKEFREEWARFAAELAETAWRSPAPEEPWLR